MSVIGVAGRLGAGKSLVAKLLAQRGARVLDADRMAHRFLEPGCAQHKRLVACFGLGILSPDGRIDRAKLGSEVFSDQSKLEALNRIVHPALLAEIKGNIEAFREQDQSEDALVIDAALLFQWKLDRWCNVALWVDADREERKRRVVESGRMTAGQFDRRDAMQDTLSPSGEEENLKRIENSGTRSELTGKIDEIWKKVNYENRKNK